jgi:hypothetical protein
VEVGEILSRSECTDGADVSLLALYESGHTPFYNEDQSFLDEGETPTTLDTTQLAWEFCSQFEKAVEPDLTSSTAAPTKAPVSSASTTKSGKGKGSKRCKGISSRTVPGVTTRPTKAGKSGKDGMRTYLVCNQASA